MNLKQRFSFIFSSLFSVVLATVMLTIYFLFANFRKDEFADRLAEKAQTTAKLLIEVKEIDYNMQKTIDRNSINHLYNESTQIYNDAQKLLYNTNDTLTVRLAQIDLAEIKAKQRVFKKIGKYEVLGMYYQISNNSYYVLISAEDTYGNSHLEFLRFVLLCAFIVGTVVVWILSFTVSKQNLQPLDNFRRRIQEITDSNLKVRLSEARQEDEINALASSFNQMMDRIDNAYNRQKDFTGNASHELRTPVARIAAQLENLLHSGEVSAASRPVIASIADDTFQLSEVISSLVAMADINSREHQSSFVKLRVDEILFNAVAELSKMYPHFKLKFEIENETQNETDLEISGDETLLRIAFVNLLKNAFIYSDNGFVECVIKQSTYIAVYITNTGIAPDVNDTAMLFTTFYRGSNTKNIPGSGIGLSIVNRALQYHNASIKYFITNNNTNTVVVTFAA